MVRIHAVSVEQNSWTAATFKDQRIACSEAVVCNLLLAWKGHKYNICSLDLKKCFAHEAPWPRHAVLHTYSLSSPGREEKCKFS